MNRRVLALAVIFSLIAPPVRAWLPAGPLADPFYEEILTLENSRTTSGRLVELASNPAPNVRARALRALGRAQSPGLSTLFATALADPDPSVRDEAALGMGLLWGEGDETALIKAFGTESDRRVRATIVEAVGRTATAGTGVPFLAAHCGDADTLISFRAALGLGVAGYRKVDISAVVDSLGLAARSRHDGTRWGAAWALYRGNPDAAARILPPLIKDRNPLVRMNALRAIGASKRQSLALPVSEAVRDGDWHVRLEAIRALAALHATQFASMMSLGLDDEIPLVQVATIKAFGDLQDQAGMPYIGPLVTETDDWRIRSAAIVARTKIEGDGALPLLEQLGTNADWHIRKAAADGMAILKSDQARAILSRMTADENPQVLAAVASALSDFPQVAALDDLRTLLKSEDIAVLTNASSALGQRADRSSLGALSSTYTRLRSPTDIEPMVEILHAIGNIIAPKDSTLILGTLDKSERAAAIATLEAGLKDPDRNVASAAADALTQIDGKDRSAMLPAASAGAFPLDMDGIRTPKGGKARIVTAKGDLMLELLPGAAPNTVANFLGLAARGYFNGLTFHRVEPNFVTQGGCPRGDGWGGPGYAIRCEYNDLHYDTGMVGMALSGKDTGGSQFFITQTPQPHLDGRYTIFARVVSGMDTLEEILIGEPIVRVDLIPS